MKLPVVEIIAFLFISLGLSILVTGLFLAPILNPNTVHISEEPSGKNPIDTFSDEEILAINNDDAYKLSPGFYQEALTHRVNYITTVDILPAAQRSDKPPGRQLCANSSEHAWSYYNATTAQNFLYWMHVNVTETEKYYEFYRRSENPKYGKFYRIYACSYFTPGTPNNHKSSANPINYTFGYLNQRPLDNHLLQEFIEYQWFSLYYTAASYKVLFSHAETEAGAERIGLENTNLNTYTTIISHAIYFMSNVNGHTISIRKWSYYLDTNTGLVSYSFETLKDLCVRPKYCF